MPAGILPWRVVCFLAVLLSLFPETLLAGSSENETSVNAAIDLMYRAAETGDTTTMRGLLAPELRLFLTEKTKQSAPKGPEWLASFCRMIQRGTRVHFQVEWKESGQDGDLAWYRAIETVRWVKNGEQEPVTTSRWLTTQIWTRRDGRWLVLHAHHSFIPPSTP